MKIAVLLACHNRKDKTIKCLKYLFNAEIPQDHTFEVFLVDDGSTDNTTQTVKKKFPMVTVIPGDGNLFWNKGMKLAWETAVENQEYDYYLWLNDDVSIFKNSIVTLLENHSKFVNSIICGVFTSKTENKITYGGRDKLSKLIIPDDKTPKLCYYINGNMVLIPKVIYHKIGMLDRIFPHAIGDYDYGLRAIKNGFECRVSSKIVGYCELNTTLPAWCRPEATFFKRIKSLYSPLGNSHPYYFFIYEFRHFGIGKALKHLITIHLRLLLPKLWLK